MQPTLRCYLCNLRLRMRMTIKSRYISTSRNAKIPTIRTIPIVGIIITLIVRTSYQCVHHLEPWLNPRFFFYPGKKPAKKRKANKKRRDANFILRPAVFIPLYKVRKIAFAENHPSGNSAVGYAATFHAMEGKLFNDGIHNTIAIVYLLLNR